MAIVASEAERNAAFAREIKHLASSLGRTIAIEHSSAHPRVVQTCPLCDAVLGNLLDKSMSPARIHRELFTQYDQHRCVVSTGAFEKFERAERALVTAMERIAVISDPELRARAELEADRMAAFCDELRKQL